jgi:hypothetical protein
VIDSAESRIKGMNGADMSDEEVRELFDAVVAVALFKPALDMEAAMRVGVIEGVDIGARYSSSTLKGDVKVRLWQSADESHVVSAMAGVGYQGKAGPSIITYISWQEFSRFDADISVMYGYDHSDYFRAYAGPRVIRSWLSVTPKLDPELREAIPQEYDDYRPDQYFQDENLLYIGATGGVMVGYKWVWVHLEATAMYTFFTPEILGETRDLSGLALVPVTGLTFEF